MSFPDLIRNSLVTHDRTCNKLREERNIEGGVAGIFLHLAVASINVDNVGHCLKRKERNTDRQGYIQGIYIGM